MDRTVLAMLDLAEGPVFRFAFALMIFGLIRNVLLSGSDAVGAYLTLSDRAAFRRKFRDRLLWQVVPSLVLKHYRGGGGPMLGYHVAICCVSLVFRFAVVLLPVFMVAHVYLVRSNVGLAWPTFAAQFADALSVTIIGLGSLLFFMRVYSPMLRRFEPSWTFLKPLILIIPFITGTLAMHPAWCPLDYYAMRLLHVLSASVVFALVPFARMLSCVHTRLGDLVPEAAWAAGEEPADAGAALGGA